MPAEEGCDACLFFFDVVLCCVVLRGVAGCLGVVLWNFDWNWGSSYVAARRGEACVTDMISLIFVFVSFLLCMHARRVVYMAYICVAGDERARHGKGNPGRQQLPPEHNHDRSRGGPVGHVPGVRQPPARKVRAREENTPHTAPLSSYPNMGYMLLLIDPTVKNMTDGERIDGTSKVGQTNGLQQYILLPRTFCGHCCFVVFGLSPFQKGMPESPVCPLACGAPPTLRVSNPDLIAEKLPNHALQ